MRVAAAFFFLFALLVVACKHQEKIAKSAAPSPSPSQHAQSNPRDTGMTAQKASEEEIFVQGCIEKSIGNNRRALSYFIDVLDKNPNNAAANYEVAGLYEQMGQPDRALKYAQSATTLNPKNPWYAMRYAQLLQENGQQEQAVKILKTLTDADPNNTALLFTYAAALKKAGDPDGALKAYDRIESIEGISDTLTQSRISIYEAKGDKISEENALNAMVKAFPTDTKNYLRLGDFYTTSGQAEKAAGVYRQMAQKFPSMVTPHLRLANYYRSQNQPDKAYSEAMIAFSLPEDLSEKVAFMQQWYPNSEEAPALSAAQKKEVDSLSAVLRRTHPDRAEPYTLSGDYFYKEGKLAEARDMYHKAAAMGQDVYAPWKRLLEINDKLKDDAAQEKDCKQVMDLFPTQPDAYYYLGVIQFNRKDYKHAIDNLETGKDYLFDNPALEMKIKTMLIEAYRANGDDHKADAYAEELIKNDSTNIPLIVSYATSLIDRGENVYKAEQLMLKVVEKDPSNASHLELLGWAEYKLNDFKEAEKWMQQALEKQPDNARINERMGDISYRLGNKTDAVKYWKKAKEKGGSSPALDKKIASQAMEENE